MTPAEFVEMCRELKELGATEVHVGDMHARFGLAPRPSAKPTKDVPETFASEQTIEQWRARAARGT